MHDVKGNLLNQGDIVAFPISFGSIVQAQIVAISSGLVNPNNPNHPAVPTATVVLTMDIPAQSNGVLPGVLKIADAPKPADKEPNEQISLT